MSPATPIDDGVVCAIALSSSTIRRRTAQSDARFIDSYRAPWPSVPSPMKTTAMPSSPRSFFASATPRATGTSWPWIPELMNPGACRCWLPPRPPHTPSALPISSARNAPRSPPEARKWPWQRCVLKIASPGPSLLRSPTAIDSWPIEVCVVPDRSPWEWSWRSFSSVRRMTEHPPVELEIVQHRRLLGHGSRVLAAPEAPTA